MILYLKGRARATVKSENHAGRGMGAAAPGKAQKKAGNISISSLLRDSISLKNIEQTYSNLLPHQNQDIEEKNSYNYNANYTAGRAPVASIFFADFRFFSKNLGFGRLG
ncbi:MAG: hypothetical protein JSU94_10425 [Phycisphaerales bacterium]|nr:MAG: hypothetical protein JSU94_10425 [Phycisphaerales bacterium]